MRQSLLLLFLVFSYTLALPIGQAELDPNYDPEYNPDLFEGDILLVDPSEADLPNGPKNAVRDPSRLWPGGVIPYQFNSNYTDGEIAIFNKIVEEYHNKTCLKFIPRTDEVDYVYIMQTGGGCSSYVGRIGGPQRMSLDSSCFLRYGTPMHELMHSSGFHHEQSRTDRDDFVFVNYDNIQPGKENNFVSYSQDVIQYLGAPYDYGSVLHYSAYGFAINSSIPTIIVLQEGAEIGQRLGFSEVDLFKLNALYNCDGGATSTY